MDFTLSKGYTILNNNQYRSTYYCDEDFSEASSMTDYLQRANLHISDGMILAGLGMICTTVVTLYISHRKKRSAIKLIERESLTEEQEKTRIGFYCSR